MEIMPVREEATIFFSFSFLLNGSSQGTHYFLSYLVGGGGGF